MLMKENIGLSFLQYPSFLQVISTNFRLQLGTIYVSRLISFATRYNSEQILGSKSNWIIQYDILRKLI